MSENVFELMQQKKQKEELTTLVACNEKTASFGLTLTKEDANALMECRNDTLKKYKRVEFGNGILDKLMIIFCDSQYINQDSYLETLELLQDIFYEFKNEACDLVSDDELLLFMKEQFETICFGDLDYLEGTCLDQFATAVRAGYKGYISGGGAGAYEELDEQVRWDKTLYLEALKELCWR